MSNAVRRPLTTGNPKSRAHGMTGLDIDIPHGGSGLGFRRASGWLGKFHIVLLKSALDLISRIPLLNAESNEKTGAGNSPDNIVPWQVAVIVGITPTRWLRISTAIFFNPENRGLPSTHCIWWSSYA
jgi:hypothetical protein